MLSDWQTHKQYLSVYLQKRLDDVDAIDDVLQEVYIKASTNLHQLKSKENLKAWLYRIAHSCLMDHYRQQLTYEPLPEELVAQETAAPQKSYRELAQCIAPLIAQLPEKYALPLQLAELEGLSQQQIADQLGLSLSGAKSRVQRGRAQFKQRLLDCCEVELEGGEVVDFNKKQA